MRVEGKAFCFGRIKGGEYSTYSYSIGLEGRFEKDGTPLNDTQQKQDKQNSTG